MRKSRVKRTARKMFIRKLASSMKTAPQLVRLIASEHGSTHEQILRGFVSPQLRRQFIEKKLRGIAAKNPNFSKAVFVNNPNISVSERQFKGDLGEVSGWLMIVEKLGAKGIEELLARGAKQRELKQISRNELPVILKFGTKENITFLKENGVSQDIALKCSRVFMHSPKDSIKRVLSYSNVHLPWVLNSPEGLSYFTMIFDDAKSRGKPSEALAFMHLLNKKTNFRVANPLAGFEVFKKEIAKHGLKGAISELKGKYIFPSLKEPHYKIRKTRFDLRRQGRPIMKHTFERARVNPMLLQKISEAGIWPFSHTMMVHRTASSIPNIAKNRFLLTLAVPEHSALMKEMTRNPNAIREEHFRGVLCFADIRIEKVGENKVLVIQETQSDIIPKLPIETQEKYASWQKLLILYAGIFAYGKEKIDTIYYPSSRIMSKLWPKIQDDRLTQNYNKLLLEMGFNPIALTKKATLNDSAFGNIHQGSSHVMFKGSVKALMIKYGDLMPVLRESMLNSPK